MAKEMYLFAWLRFRRQVYDDGRKTPEAKRTKVNVAVIKQFNCK